MSVSKLLEWFRYTVKVTGFLHWSLRLLYQQSVVCQQQVFPSLFVFPLHLSQCLCVTHLTTRGSLHNKLCSPACCTGLLGEGQPHLLVAAKHGGNGLLGWREGGRGREGESRWSEDPKRIAVQKTKTNIRCGRLTVSFDCSE